MRINGYANAKICINGACWGYNRVNLRMFIQRVNVTNEATIEAELTNQVSIPKDHWLHSNNDLSLKVCLTIDMKLYIYNTY